MCNLYQAVPRDDIELYFRAMVWDGYAGATIGPLGRGLFLRPRDGELEAVAGQWGMIPPGSPTRRPMTKPKGPAYKLRPLSTNNARLETIATAWTYRYPWQDGKRCLIPATQYAEPNWQTGKNIWWHLRRADGLPWALAGLWSEWTDPETGEVVPNYTMVTRNCDDHPLLNRLHKPDPKLPPDRQDKRAVVHVEPALWAQWLHGSGAEAQEVLGVLPEAAFYEQADRIKTDEVLAARG